MIPATVRTPDDLRAARDFLGLSADDLARVVGVEDGRTVRRWEAGDRELPGPVIVVMETALGYLRKIEALSLELELLRTGQMRSGTNGIDDTKATIDRTAEAKKSYEEAFEILVRRAVPGEAARQVHWYHLRRMTPKFDPREKDDWSLPGELSPEAALAYFERHEGFNGGLEFCEDGDFSADFTLEQREAIRRQYGASQRITPGELVRTFFVRNKRGALNDFRVLREGTGDFDGVILHAFDRNKLVIAMIRRSALEDTLDFGGEGRPTIAQCADVVKCNISVLSEIIQNKYSRADYKMLSRSGSTNPYVDVALADIEKMAKPLQMPQVKLGGHLRG
jgi:transcriptional regulator with XRE-family HTH domain